MEVNALSSWNSIYRDLHKFASQRIPSREWLRWSPRNGKGKPEREGKVVADLNEVIASRRKNLFHSIVSSKEQLYPKEHVHKRRTLTWLIWFCFRRAGKGFVIGFVGKLLFSIVPYLLKSRGNLFRFIVMMKKMAKGTTLDAISNGLFLASFLGIFELLLRLLRTCHHKTLETLSGPLSGAVASLSLLFMPKQSQSTISLFFALRACEIICKFLYSAEILPDIPVPDFWVMYAGTVPVLWAWMFDRSLLDPSYRKFLDVQGGIPIHKVKRFALLLCLGRDSPLTQLLDISYASDPFPMELVEMLDTLRVSNSTQEHYHLCTQTHPNSNCDIHFLQFILKSLQRTLPVYAPIHLLPLFLFRFPQLCSNPLGILFKTSTGIMRSSLFLSTYCASAWYFSCMMQRTIGARLGDQSILIISLGALSVLMENKSRRSELALYVLAQGVRVTSALASRSGIVPRIPFIEVLVFMAASSVIMASYVDDPQLMRPSYRYLLKGFFGSSDQTMKYTTPLEDQ